MIKKGKKGPSAPRNRKFLVGLVALFSVIGALLALGMFREHKARTAAVESAPAPKPSALLNETPSLDAAPQIQAPPVLAPPPKCRLAMIIDDIGQRREPVEKLLALGVPITFSVLPDQPHTKELDGRIAGAGAEVMLHLPMEPEEPESHDPGAGALTVTLPDEDIKALIARSLAQVPHAKGVNNHMGSLFTRDERKMRVALEELKGRGLFFVDSLTTPKSAAHRIAKELGIRSAARRIFLDDEEDPAAVERNLRLAVALAARDGEAVAIGHPYQRTLEALASMKAECEKAGVTPVFVSELAR